MHIVGLVNMVYPWGNDIAEENASYSGTEASPIGSFSPNDYGLYDMTGNVWGWCSDWYSDSYYLESPVEAAAFPPGHTRTLVFATLQDSRPMSYIRRYFSK